MIQDAIEKEREAQVSRQAPKKDVMLVDQEMDPDTMPVNMLTLK